MGRRPQQSVFVPVPDPHSFRTLRLITPTMSTQVLQPTTLIKSVRDRRDDTERTHFKALAAVPPIRVQGCSSPQTFLQRFVEYSQKTQTRNRLHTRSVKDVKAWPNTCVESRFFVSASWFFDRVQKRIREMRKIGGGRESEKMRKNSKHENEEIEMKENDEM